MNNIFKDAYFGKPYKTSDNTIVKFVLQRYEDDFIIYIPKCKYSVETTHRYNSKGEYYLGNGEYGHGALDIVSELQPISEEELDKIALEKYPIRSEIVRNGLTFVKVDPNEPKRECFKAGFRKAKES